MATAVQNSIVARGPENGRPIPLLPSERQPHHLAKMDRVLALYYRTWMDEPELIHGVISEVITIDRPAGNGSPGHVNLRTARTPDLRTGRFIGIDINSAALLPQDVWPHLRDEDFRATWIADGSVAWDGEREMLAETVARYVAQGTMSMNLLPPTSEEHDNPYGEHHPGRAIEHTKMIPGSGRGKVGIIRLADLSMD